MIRTVPHGQESSSLLQQWRSSTHLCLLLILSFSPCAATCTVAGNSPGVDAISVAPALITIGTREGFAVSPTFMGIAHEWGDAQAMIGDASIGINLIYRNLIDNLTAYGSGPLMIRIGGNSSDVSKEPTAETARPFAELANATGAHFYLGVNLGAGNIQLAIDQTRAFVHTMPPGSLDAIEIGNEPDSYVDKGMRRAPYPFPVYLNDFDTWRQQTSPLLPPGVGIVGPSWAYPASLSNVSAFLQGEHSYLKAVTQHLYIGDACHGHVNAADTLLQPKNASTMPARMRNAVAITHSFRVPFRVDELNSIACGGQDGLSNTFGAALWAVDIMFEFANSGVDGVNWQSPNGAAYGVMSFNSSHLGNNRTYSIKSVSPLYYGLLFFQEATGNRSHLLPVTLDADSTLKAWATRDASGKLRLILINKGNVPKLIRIAEPAYHGSSILRLVAPSPSAKIGVRFAGQTLDGSIDGKLKGAREQEFIQPHGGTFLIPIGSASALIAEFDK